MIRFLSRRSSSWLFLLFLGLAAARAAVVAPAPQVPPPAAPAAVVVPRPLAAERNFKTSATLSTEAIYVIKILEAAHYNRATVSPSDYGEIVTNYMTALDGQHLFYLGSDKADFTRRYDGQTVYYKVAVTGDIDPAYAMYYVWKDRFDRRINWIFGELKQNFDFNGNDTYGIDRSKAAWPATAADADDLWRRRLKFELIGEMLNKKTVEQAKEIVRKRYERMLKNQSDIDGPDLAEIYLTAIAALYDPHSSYFSADTYEDFGIQMKLQLVGIGAMLRLKDDYCTVEELVPGGPAELGHLLKPGDKIIAVAQENREPVDIIGMKLRKVVNMIRGQKGSRVHLTVEPASAAAGNAVRTEIIITRDVVKLNSARAHGAIFEVPGPDAKEVPIGVITLPEFYGPAEDPASAGEKTSASRDTAELISRMKQAGVQAMVLDLRRNGGGYLGEAVNLAGLFIPHGPVVQVRDSDGRKTVDEDEAAGAAYDGPMAVLTDRFSASASEIVAGALQNYGRAIVVGDRTTHGKGTVQTVVEMKNVSRELALATAKTGAAKITIQKFYLPNGSSTQLRGVVPDISLPSINDFLPVGESSLPHALIWDSITGTQFDGHPLDGKVLALLAGMSAERQAKLDEFAYLRRNVDRFKMRQDQKLIPLNLEERTRQKQDDDDFVKAVKAERAVLAKDDYPHQEIWLGAPPPPKVKPPKKEDGTDEDDDASALSTDDDKPYPSMDVHLRETFRILEDAIKLGHDRGNWVSNHPPLTIAAK